MLKKVILCGAVLLAFSDADCIRSRMSSRPNRGISTVRIENADTHGMQSIFDDERRELQKFRYSILEKLSNSLSEAERQTIVAIGNRWRDQHPNDPLIPWTELLRDIDSDINPSRAGVYYCFMERFEISGGRFPLFHGVPATARCQAALGYYNNPDFPDDWNLPNDPEIGSGSGLFYTPGNFSFF
jgi:hypothetical protein